MLINIIGNTNIHTGVSQDMEILHGMIAHVFGKETGITHVPHNATTCEQAEINFFIEVISPNLFMYASKNIWIPNPEWTYKTWKPYAEMVDEIWVKTREAEKIFSEWTTKPVKYIGWTSFDKYPPEKKNFHKAIVPVGKNIWRNPKPIVQAYMRIQQTDPSLFNSLPELHIVHSPQHVKVPPIPESVATKIKVHGEVMKQKEYDELLQECGLCICMSAAEGFGHAVNEAMSSGCLLMLSPIQPFRELTKEAYWVSNAKEIEHPHCLGNLEDIDISSLVDALTLYATSQFLVKKSKTSKVRREYEDRHQAFVKRMEEVLGSFKDLPTYSLDARLPKEEDLPNVSVITLTRDRRWFIPLVKYCLAAQTYPADKIEWVVVDDGKDQIKDLISDVPNVKYILIDEPLTIGEKRNLAVEYASHDVLVMMDDDDVYPSNSILTRVAHMLAEPRKDCLFSSTIACFEIHESKSFMNVPPRTLPMAERVSEATLCFTRDFWNARKFPDQQIGEGIGFITGREQSCREFNIRDIIVSLIHKKNTTHRKPPPMEPNGCHYGFSDELYTLLAEIGQGLLSES